MVVAGTSEGLEDVPGETELEEEEALKRCGCTHHLTVDWSGFGCMKCTALPAFLLPPSPTAAAFLSCITWWTAFWRTRC